ncbi:MAG: hypothetical protein ABSC49_00675 [Candidatus Microgenomates bacterium]|jgi:hypothetical protein
MLSDLFSQIQASALPNSHFGGNSTIGDFVKNSGILNYVFGAAGIALLIYLILGGFQMMLSRGDPKAMQGAQAKITNALIGFVIIIIAFFIVQLLGQLLGIQNTIFGQIFSISTKNNSGYQNPPLTPQ